MWPKQSEQFIVVVIRGLIKQFGVVFLVLAISYFMDGYVRCYEKLLIFKPGGRVRESDCSCLYGGMIVQNTTKCIV